MTYQHGVILSDSEESIVTDSSECHLSVEPKKSCPQNDGRLEV